MAQRWFRPGGDRQRFARSLRQGRTAAWCLALLGWLSPPQAAHALRFDFVCSGDPSCASLNGNALAGFQSAAARWSSLLFDPISVKVQIGFTALGTGILGQTSSTDNFASYSSFRAALGLDRQSSADQQAFASLPAGPAFRMLINRTLDNPNGVGSSTAYVDGDGGLNNVVVNLTTANVKALGGTPDYGSDAATLDGAITFSSHFSWDFDPADGITAGAFDFVAVATHELGHALGFISGVDVLDENSPSSGNYYNDDQFTSVNPLDFFRYSAESYAAGVIDWTADARPKYFSIDAGFTGLAAFSTGVTHGDGRQASHWKDNLSLGLMDPTLAPGEPGTIRALDLLALDVIGYNTMISKAPAPLPLLGASSLLLWSRRLRRRSHQAGRRH